MNAKIVNYNGYRKISINGTVFDNALFRSFCPSEKTISAAYNAGIRLMNIFPSGLVSSVGAPYSEFGEFWLGKGVYRFDVLRRQIDLFIRNAPDAYFSIILQLDTRDWYIKNHEGAVDSFSSISDMAGDIDWREAGTQMLSDVLDFLDMVYPDRFYAVYICAGGTCEWLQRNDPDNASPLKRKAFSRWKGDETASLCSTREAEKSSCGVLRDPEKDQDALDFWQFHNQIIAEAVCYFAAQAKRLRPNLLVGCFFGYFFYAYATFLKKGHSAFSQVAACPDIDMIFSPASYSFRGLTSVSASQLPIDSVTLHNKIYYHEIDNTTFDANDNLFAQVLQSYAHKRHSSRYESVQYMRRETALMMSKRQSYWWFDMFGGWYDSKEMSHEIKKIDEAYRIVKRYPASSVSETALIIDGNSVAFYRSDSPLHCDQVHMMREIAGRIGAPVDCFEAETLTSEAFPHSQYKLYIFANLIAPSDLLARKINEIRKSGASCIFLHAAGVVCEGRFDFENIRRLCGIHVLKDDQSSQYIIFNNDLLCGKAPDKSGLLQRCETAAATPGLCCDDKGALPIGFDLLRRDHIRAALKRREEGFDAWFASGPIPETVLRRLAEEAGVFIYQNDGLPVYAHSRMLAVFAHKAGTYQLHLPLHVKKLTGLYEEESYSELSGEIQLSFQENECKCFLIN